MSDEPRKPTVPEVLPLVEAYYSIPGHSCGGSLHIVLDDDNCDDSHVEFCLDYARKNFDLEGMALAYLLHHMSKTQRHKLCRTHGHPPADSVFNSADQAAAEFWRIAEQIEAATGLLLDSR